MTRELDYFGNPQVAKLLDLSLGLAMELHMAHQRALSLEMLLIRKEIIFQGELDAFKPLVQEQERLAASRDGLMSRVMDILTEDGPAEHPLRDEWRQRLP
jgi:hypothetical protein